MGETPFWIIDAFVGERAGRILRGNPAAVVLLSQFAPDEILQECANEFNLSETAFVVPHGPHNFDLRWFTPRVEVDLCGHATLAATAALCDAKLLFAGQTASFETRSGNLKALVREEGNIELDFPAQDVEDCAMPTSLSAALRLSSDPVLFCGRASDDWLLRVEPKTLANLRPDFGKLAKVEGRGVIVTALSETPNDEADFTSRFFAPRVGINEDPVTGSAHTKLAPFWAARLGKTKMNAVQLSERGGRLELELRGERVGIAGPCRVRARGHLC